MDVLVRMVLGGHRPAVASTVLLYLKSCHGKLRGYHGLPPQIHDTGNWALPATPPGDWLEGFSTGMGFPISSVCPRLSHGLKYTVCSWLIEPRPSQASGVAYVIRPNHGYAPHNLQAAYSQSSQRFSHRPRRTPVPSALTRGATVLSDLVHPCRAGNPLPSSLLFLPPDSR